MKAAIAIFGALVATVIVLTLMTGGAIQLGTSPAGPNFQFGFTGAQAKAA